MSRRRLLIALPIVAAVLLVGGPWLYINVIREDPPERLTLSDVTTTTTEGDGSTSTPPSTQPEGIEGEWVIGAGSVAGYRVQEVLFGQEAEAVGRTESVTGTMTISGTSVTATEVIVDMTTVESDESQRDRQFQGRIMATDQFPTATFTLTEPIDLGAVPADGEEATYTVTGDLTLRGVTRAVLFELVARTNGTTIEAVGSIHIDFDGWDIPDASGGPAQVGRNGELELLLVFARA